MTAASVRELVARMRGDEKHAAASTSVLDVLFVLYDRVLRVSPASLADPDRDRFLLSKGHGPMAYYAVLAAKGFFPASWLDAYGAFDSPLGFHPDRNRLPGVEISSGSLGHGLGIAVGVALGLRAQGRARPRVFVLVGDGELDEGSNWEAVHYAAAVGLDRLVAVVVDNRSATYPLRSGIAAHFEAAGWDAVTVSASDHDALAAALGADGDGAPRAVVARTDE